ncbi:MAG: tetratricopeptide repeat protein [Deltaproteobacteria bacterium]|nr:tetratricopeptide repeat protein [Deltaproteobacteria bacterium]
MLGIICNKPQKNKAIGPLGLFTILSIIITFFTILISCKTDIQSGIESANDLLYKKQYVAAERLYHKLLKRLENENELSEAEDKQRMLIMDRLGKVNALYLHDYNQAIHYYQKLVQQYPRTEYAFSARAMIADIYHHTLGNLEAAISEYQKLVAEFPNKKEARWAQLQISGAFFQLKDYEQARTEAGALINRWPNSSEAAQARFQIANSYYVQGRYADATATYEQLLEGKPDPSFASLVLFEMGNCYQELGDLDRSLAYYYATLADHPNPLLVQRKIRHLRRRLDHVRPAEDIQLPDYVQRRLAVANDSTGKHNKNNKIASPSNNENDLLNTPAFSNKNNSNNKQLKKVEAINQDSTELANANQEESDKKNKRKAKRKKPNLDADDATGLDTADTQILPVKPKKSETKPENIQNKSIDKPKSIVKTSDASSKPDANSNKPPIAPAKEDTPQ